MEDTRLNYWSMFGSKIKKLIREQLNLSKYRLLDQIIYKWELKKNSELVPPIANDYADWIVEDPPSQKDITYKLVG